MEYQTIQIADNGEGVHTLTLFQPEKRNAISIRMREEIIACLAGLAQQDELKVLIFTGSGPAFSAGFDLREFGEPDKREALVDTSMAYHRDVWNFPRPTIAAVNGFAFGGGFDLATFCDIRLGSERAVFGHPEIKFGGHPIVTPLRWIVGEGLARDICFTGRHIDAAEAHRMGLLSEVLPKDDLMPRALEFARMIAEAPLETLINAKRYMARNGGMDFEQSFQIEHDEPFSRRLEKP